MALDPEFKSREHTPHHLYPENGQDFAKSPETDNAGAEKDQEALAEVRRAAEKIGTNAYAEPKTPSYTVEQKARTPESITPLDPEKQRVALLELISNKEVNLDSADEARDMLNALIGTEQQE